MKIVLIKRAIKIFLLLVIIISLVFVHLLHGEYGITGRLNRAIYDGNIIELEKILKKCTKREINSLPFNQMLARLMDFYNRTPLENACMSGEYQMVKLLIEYGADVNFTNPYTGRTPLLAATYAPGKEEVKIVKFLIECGADINVADNYGNTPLLGAVHLYYSDNMSEQESEYQKTGTENTIYLIEHCTSLEIKKHQHSNILECAIANNNVPIVKYLIENHYFGISDFSENGMTILHFAVKKNSVNVCKYLLEQGANQNILDADGKTAYNYALENGNEDMIALFNN